MTMEQRVQHQLGILVWQVLTLQVENEHLQAQVEAMKTQLPALQTPPTAPPGSWVPS